MPIPKAFGAAFAICCILVLIAITALTLPLGSYLITLPCTAANLLGFALLIPGGGCFLLLLRIPG
ncbi:MAG: hypothetical protein IJ443_09225 [Firmicutes bacterium]|nr:hypothetical protein [Bacillota bacterium]